MGNVLRPLIISVLFAAIALFASSCSKAPAPSDSPVAASQPQDSMDPPVPAGSPPVARGKHDHHAGPPGRSPASLPAQPTEDDLIEQSLQNLKQGHLAYQTPARMKTGESQTVTARIGSEQVNGAELVQGLGQNGQSVSVAATPVSVKMKMTLKSTDFDITPLSSEEQVVGGTIPTSWEWTVTPRHAGTLRLHLDAVVELKNISRDFTTVDRDIAVSVDPKDAFTNFVQHNWQWILTTLAGGIGLAWKFLGARSKEKSGATKG